MARITEDPRRPGVVIVDHRDPFGRRKKPSFPKTPEGIRRANLELAIIQSQGRAECAVAPDIVMTDYVERVLALMTRQVIDGVRSHGTVDNYERLLRLHVLPTCGWMKVQAITRQKVQTLLDDRKMRGECSRGHLGQIYSAVSTVLSWAVDDGILFANPLFRPGGKKSRRDKDSHHIKTLETKAMEREERDLFLDTALIHEPRWYPPLATLVFAGLRIGELRGLQKADVRLYGDPPGIRIKRQVLDKRDKITGRVVAKPKTDAADRTVDLASRLSVILRPLVQRQGRSPWLWFDCDGDPTLTESRAWTQKLRDAMDRVQEGAGLMHPGRDPRVMVPRFTPHHLRHTFACLIITQQAVRPGDLLLYLKDQLGHEDVQMTARVYARWLKQRSQATVDAGADRGRTGAPPAEPPTGTVLPFRK